MVELSLQSTLSQTKKTSPCPGVWNHASKSVPPNLKLPLHLCVSVYTTKNVPYEEFNVLSNLNKKAVLSQANRAMPQLFFSV